MHATIKNNWQKQLNTTLYLVRRRINLAWTLMRLHRDPRRLWSVCSHTLVSLVQKHSLLVVLVPSALLFIALASTLIHRDNLHLSYASGTSCFDKIVFLPNLQRATKSSSYQLSLERPFAVGGKELFSRQACASLTSLPKENSREALNVSFLGNKFIKQVVAVSAPEFPTVNTDALTKKQLSVGQALVLPTENGQVVFDYEAAANNKRIVCEKSSQNIVCPVKELNLAQGETYKVTLGRLFRGKPAGTLYSGDVQTASPIEVTNSSIAAGSTVFDKPAELVLTTNKKITSAVKVSLVSGAGEAAKTVDLTSTVQENQLTLRFNKELNRDIDFTLTLENLTAEDNGELDRPYALHFRTSGGPKVAGTNTAAYGVAVTQPFTVTFDQDLLPSQDFASRISLTTTQGAVPARVSVFGRRVTLTPTTNLAKCTSFTLKVDGAVQSIHGVSGSSSWTLRSRTQCATVSIIGYSVQGRAIYAYRFGHGTSKIIFVGNMHGNEKSGKYLLDKWVDELEANPSRIPANRSLIIIPTINPDGLASSSRLNVHGVDLNRNFPANDWATSVGVPGPQILPQGGGPAPLSEPEASALAAFVENEQPRLVLTFHSKGSVVIANGAGDSNALAGLYAGKSPYWLGADQDADEIFGYPTTGEFEDWLYDKKNIPALLIEMATDIASEFTGNRNALWAMTAIP